MSKFFMYWALWQCSLMNWITMEEIYRRELCKSFEFTLKGTDRALFGYVINTHYVTGMMSCLMKCTGHALCNSFNYEEVLNSNKSQKCELNDLKREAACHKDFLVRPGFLYYELNGDTKMWATVIMSVFMNNIPMKSFPSHISDQQNVFQRKQLFEITSTGKSMDCSQSPCSNGGSCMLGDISKCGNKKTFCKCISGYHGIYCEKIRYEPKTCKHYQNNGLNQGDGEYILYPKWPECNQTTKIYCVDMGSSTPLEYVTLPAAKNFAVYYNIKNRKEQTNFEKIRLNVTSMKVFTEDYRFATKIGLGNFNQFASAGDCVSDSCDGKARIGNFNVDITGTSFCLPQSIPYKFSSHPPCVIKVFFPSMSPDRKRWSGKCGGRCGRCNPKEIVLDIDGC